MNESQRITVQYADQVKQRYIALEPILNAAISGKVIEHVSGVRSDELPLNFDDEACQYEIVKDKVKVYTMQYKHPTMGIFSVGSSDKSYYDSMLEDVKNMFGCVILKETVEEVEV